MGKQKIITISKDNIPIFVGGRSIRFGGRNGGNVQKGQDILISFVQGRHDNFWRDRFFRQSRGIHGGCRQIESEIRCSILEDSRMNPIQIRNIHLNFGIGGCRNFQSILQINTKFAHDFLYILFVGFTIRIFWIVPFKRHEK